MAEPFPALWDWLARTAGGAVHQSPPSWEAWHGRLMTFAWLLAIPLGVAAARYLKVWPGQDWPRRLDHRGWWHAHRLLQTAGLLAATGGLWLAWRNAPGTGGLARAHALLGWAAMLLGWAQAAGGALRGSKGGPTDPRGADGDHFLMTPRRIVFEYTHKIGGYAALVLAALAVPTGLALADAPRWMWLAAALWGAALAVAAIRLQRMGRCIDTYQAIWGPVPDLPGNRRTPIGWGIVRPLGRPTR